jgi:hypothetical protein
MPQKRIHIFAYCLSRDYLIYQYLVTFVTAITSIFLARELGVQARGEVAQLVLLFAWFYSLQSFMHPGTLQYNKYDLSEYLSKYINYVKGATILVIVSSSVLSVYLSKVYLLLLIPYFILYYLNELFQHILYRFGFLRLYWRNQIIFQVANLLVIVACVLFSPYEQSILIAWIIGQAVFLRLNILSILRLENNNLASCFNGVFRAKTALKDISDNIKNYGYHIGKGLVSSGDRLIIVFLFTTEQYAAFIVMYIFNSIMMPFAGYVTVNFTKIVKDGVLKKVDKNKLLVSSSVFIFGVISLYFVSDWVVIKVLGEQYASSAYLAKYIIIFSLFAVAYTIALEFTILKYGVTYGYGIQISYLICFTLGLFILKNFVENFEIRLVPIAQSMVYIGSIGYMLLIRKVKLRT